MKAIEINSKTDKNGDLKINYHLHVSDCKVRVLLLIEEETDQEEEKVWINAISKNPAYSFLNDPAEDIYSINDGKPLDD
jgi:hypothetical protein